MNFHWRHSRLHTRIFFFSNAVLPTASPRYCTLLDVSTIQNTSFTELSTLWDASCPTFLQNFCAHFGHGCLFSSFLFESRFPSFCPPLFVPQLRNQIVGGASQSAPTLCSTCSRHLVTQSGDTSRCFGESSNTCRLPHTAIHTTGATKHRQGGKRRFTRKADTHRHTAARSCSKSQRRVHYRTIQVYIKSP